MAARLADVLEADGTAPPYPGDSTGRSNEHIVALAGKPWGDHMEWLRRIADEALRAMRHDARRLPASHAAIGHLVVEHEAALVAFAETELAGRPAESLAPIERFLAAHPLP